MYRLVSRVYGPWIVGQHVVGSRSGSGSETFCHHTCGHSTRCGDLTDCKAGHRGALYPQGYRKTYCDIMDKTRRFGKGRRRCGVLSKLKGASNGGLWVSQQYNQVIYQALSRAMLGVWIGSSSTTSMALV